LVEILKQPQYQPTEVEKQVLVIWAASNGYTDDIPVDKVRGFESELLNFVENSHPGLFQSIREKKSLTDEVKADLQQVLKDFKQDWNERSSGNGLVSAASDKAAVNA
jgi:F-type H+-transporting ATPase subunit alpha